MVKGWERPSAPLWEKVTNLLEPQLVNLPGAKMKLAGSYLEGTAVCGSDMDIWIYTDQDTSPRDRSKLAHRLLSMSEKELKLHGVFEIRRRKQLIGRKAIKVDLVLDDGDVVPLDIVLVNISKDVGFDDHYLFDFTQCDTRAEARTAVNSFMCGNEPAKLAVRAMKRLASENGKPVLPGFILSNLARRLVQSSPYSEELSAPWTATAACIL